MFLSQNHHPLVMKYDDWIKSIHDKCRLEMNSSSLEERFVSL